MIQDYILIIGAMKSGTTTLFDQLARDPRIAGAHPKEPGFFAFEEVFAQGWDWYEALFSFEAGTHRYALDGSTDYTKAPFVTGVADRIEAARREGRRFKLIYIVRDPIARAISHARHVQIHGKEVGQFASPRRRHDFGAAEGLSPVNLAVSDYAAQFEEYRDFHARGDLAVTTIDAIAHDGQAVMDELAAFLDLPGLRWHTESAHANAAGTQKTEAPWLTAAKRSPVMLRLGKALLPQRAKRVIEGRATVKLSAEGRFVPTEEERAALQTRYGPQLDAFERAVQVRVPAPWHDTTRS